MTTPKTVAVVGLLGAGIFVVNVALICIGVYFIVRAAACALGA
jgi:hypothetical protein